MARRRGGLDIKAIPQVPIRSQLGTIVIQPQQEGPPQVFKSPTFKEFDPAPTEPAPTVPPIDPVEEEKEKVRQATGRRRGRASTILTSERGLLEEAPILRRILLGA